MSADLKEKNYIIHPAKFSLWLFIVSIILLFGGLTSAYIVSKGIETDPSREVWHYFKLPDLFWVNTGVVIVSSIMLQIGVWGAKKGDFRRAKTGMYMTMLLGVIFLVGQVVAWMLLHDEGVPFGKAGSNNGNYMYTLTALHGLHIVAGLIYLLVVILRLNKREKSPESIISIENCATFWHFLGLLWIYLFIFLLMNQGNPLV